VTSQASGFPLAHGSRVVPSGRLLSSSIKLTGSFTAGTWARWWLSRWCHSYDCDAVVWEHSCGRTVHAVQLLLCSYYYYYYIHSKRCGSGIHQTIRGVRRILFREGLEHMASAVARAYNGGLGRSPQRGPWAEHLVGVRGRSPLKLKAFVVRRPKEVANLAHFLGKI